jgi:hypothetical protein
VNTVTAVLTATFFLVALGAGWVRANRDKAYPFIAVSGALLATFLLWNKVHSPQYTLWLLPFFVLLRVNVGWWVAYALADLAVYIGVFRFFYDFGQGRPDSWFKDLMTLGVWARAGLLLALFVVFLMSRDTLDPDLEISEDAKVAAQGSQGLRPPLPDPAS